MDSAPFFLGPLAVWRHKPTTPTPWCRLLHIHGITEHSGRHQATFDALAAIGVEVIRFDLRGAGRSGGKRQWVEHFEDYVADTVAVFNWICGNLDPLPLYLMGHSLGGAIAVHFAAIYHRDFRGLCLSGPAYLVGDSVSPITIALGKVFAKVAPTFALKKPPSRPAISRDPKVVEEYENDPLSFHHNTLQQGVEVLRALKEVPDRCAQVPLPVMIAHGSNDRIIRLEGSFELMRRFPGGDKTLNVLPGGYHEPHNDIDKAHYFFLLTQWLERQKKALGAP
jgi:alpha-beta hydrolase superfamily lysophospholipase